MVQAPQTLTPAQQVELLYERQECERSFAADLVLHLQHGYVFSTPEIFLMGKPVPREAPIEQIRHPAHVFKRQDCDTWFIYAAAGDLTRFFDYQPFALEYYGWERYSVLKIYQATRMIDRVNESCITSFIPSPSPGLMPVGA